MEVDKDWAQSLLKPALLGVDKGFSMRPFFKPALVGKGYSAYRFFLKFKPCTIRDKTTRLESKRGMKR